MEFVFSVPEQAPTVPTDRLVIPTGLISARNAIEMLGEGRANVISPLENPSPASCPLPLADTSRVAGEEFFCALLPLPPA